MQIAVSDFSLSMAQPTASLRAGQSASDAVSVGAQFGTFSNPVSLQTFTIQTSSSNEFRDIVLARHGSYDSGDLAYYVYLKGSYQEAGCYDYYWSVLEGDKVRELKEPRITPCSERNK